MIIRETNSCICTKMFSLFLPHFIKIYFAYLGGAKKKKKLKKSKLRSNVFINFYIGEIYHSSGYFQLVIEVFIENVL